MTIWAIMSPPSKEMTNEKYKQVTTFLTNSFQSGLSRFGWGFSDSSNLLNIKSKEFSSMSDDEKLCWKQANFLLNVAVGDWMVHINLPSSGYCLAAQVVDKYCFEENDNEVSDFRHIIKINTTSIIEFNRNDPRVVPLISRRLKLQGRYWAIRFEEEFLTTIANLKSESFIKDDNESTGVFYLKKNLTVLLTAITEKIQNAHPAHHLESFMAQIFRKIPGVIDVRENGKLKGWGTDHGADLIITYKSGLSIMNLEKEEKLVVQVKSFIGNHSETNAVNQIGVAIRKYNANAGMIITTAESTQTLENAINEMADQLSKSQLDGGLDRDVPISLVAGEDVARFVLKYGSDFLL